MSISTFLVFLIYKNKKTLKAQTNMSGFYEAIYIDSRLAMLCLCIINMHTNLKAPPPPPPMLCCVFSRNSGDMRLQSVT